MINIEYIFLSLKIFWEGPISTWIAGTNFHRNNNIYRTAFKLLPNLHQKSPTNAHWKKTIENWAKFQIGYNSANYGPIPKWRPILGSEHQYLSNGTKKKISTKTNGPLPNVRWEAILSEFFDFAKLGLKSTKIAMKNVLSNLKKV